MASKLIKLQDDILLEVEVPDNQLQQIAGGDAPKVNKAIDSIKPLLLKTCQPLTAVWQELNRDLSITEAEVELALGFEAEGNVFIAKGKTNASLTVRLKLCPKPE